MTLSTSRKGYPLEAWAVKALTSIGVQAKRQILSGAYGTSTGNEDLCGDVTMTIRGHAMKAECKSRSTGSGFKTLETWMRGHDALILKRDRQQPMVVLTWDAFAKLAGEGSPE